MKKFTQQELDYILELHVKWLNDEPDGVKANLCYANLEGANLEGANLYRANLDTNEEYRKGIILKEDIIGYKKCYSGAIVHLLIPKGSIVFSINGRKHRTNKCKVIKVEDRYGNEIHIAFSLYDEDFKYETNKEYEIEDFNLMYNVECSSGIHFFKTIEEAKVYNY